MDRKLVKISKIIFEAVHQGSILANGLKKIKNDFTLHWKLSTG